MGAALASQKEKGRGRGEKGYLIFCLFVVGRFGRGVCSLRWLAPAVIPISYPCGSCSLAQPHIWVYFRFSVSSLARLLTSRVVSHLSLRSVSFPLLSLLYHSSMVFTRHSLLVFMYLSPRKFSCRISQFVSFPVGRATSGIGFGVIC